MKITRAGLKFMVAIITVAAATSCASSEPTSDLDINVDSDEIRVALSEEVARGLIEDYVGADLSCEGEIDSDMKRLLEKLDRDGPRSKASYRDGEAIISARRRGGKFDLDISGRGSGRIEATMPWAIADCLLGKTTQLDRALNSSIKVKVINEDGRNFSFRLQ